MIAAALAALAAPAVQADTLQPGLSVRVYHVGRPMESLVELAPGQTPNVSFVVPELDLDSRSMDAPGGLDEMTLTEVDGWLRIPESGSYELRLDSDDGSVMWVDGQEMIGLAGLRSLGDPRVLGLEFREGDHPASPATSVGPPAAAGARPVPDDGPRPHPCRQAAPPCRQTAAVQSLVPSP
jgi:hypothetical protein